MSLVNDMLKDLDDRRRESRIGKQRLVPAGRGRHALLRGGSVRSVLLVFSLTVAAGMGYLLFADSREEADNDRPRLAPAQQMEMAVGPDDTQQAPSEELLAELEQRLADLERQNQILARQQGEWQSMNDSANSSVSNSAPDPQGAAPPSAAWQSTASQSAAPQNAQPASGRAEVALATVDSPALDDFPAADQPILSAADGPRDTVISTPRSDADAASQLFAVPVSSDRSLQRSAVELSLEELDRQQVQRALQQWAAGRQLDALQSLDSFAFQYPQAHQSREALAKLLLQQGELERAMQVADIGLSIAPAHAAYKKIKARLLFDRGQTTDALQVLNNFVPSVHQDIEYHDLMATAQLADRQYEAALATYQALLQQDPAVGRWWYGLAVAMEPLGRISEATSAYERATQQADLSLMLRQRSQQRLQELRAAEQNVVDSD